MPGPVALPAHVLLQVPFTTQAPLNNWAQHQESCEAPNLAMLIGYWQHDSSGGIDPHAADATIRQIDSMKPAPDLSGVIPAELAQHRAAAADRLRPTDRHAIRSQ